MGDRLAAGRRVLAPLTEVRILVPQPSVKQTRPIAWRHCSSFFVIQWEKPEGRAGEAFTWPNETILFFTKFAMTLVQAD